MHKATEELLVEVAENKPDNIYWVDVLCRVVKKHDLTCQEVALVCLEYAYQVGALSNED